jgi:hypothetical protein
LRLAEADERTRDFELLDARARDFGGDPLSRS